MPSRRFAATLVLATLLTTAVVHRAAQAEVTSSPPRRVLDTRSGVGSSGRLDPGEVLQLRIDGVDASDSTVVLLNLTADQALGSGFVTARPCSDPPTDTSILNVTPGHAVPNMVALEYDGSGLCFSSSIPVHLVADLNGVSTEGEIEGVRPRRLFDSRESTALEPGQEHRFRVAGRAGVAADAGSAAVNVTVVDPTADGWVLVKPCGAPSSASTINYRRGEIVPHFTFTGLTSGDLCIETLVRTDLVIDAFGFMPADSALRLVTPNRALDTRYGIGGTAGAVRDGELVSVRIAGTAGVKRGAETATINIVAVEGSAFGHVTAWPCDRPEPVASVLNMWPGVLRSNQATVALSADGDVCLRTVLSDSSAIDLVVDVVGYTGGFGEEPPTNTLPTQPPPSARFETLPVGATLPSGSECAGRVRSAVEIRPENAEPNARRGSRANANTRTDWSEFARVDGDFVGTTDEIIQWAACKWGVDEDAVRAQIIKESYWFQANVGDNGESFGLGQVRVPYHPSAFEFPVNARTSTAYNLDYTYAIWRGCFEGVFTWLNDVEHNGFYAAGDQWGCMGMWFSGRWYVNNDAYLNQPGDSVRWHYENRTWEQPWFIDF